MTRVRNTPRLGRARRGAAAGLLATAALAGLAAQSAQANVVKAAWAGPGAYIYEIVHMPDFDQRRVPSGGILGLPNNGSMYCVPTSAINLMAYAANHGFPMVDPGDEPWWAVGSVSRYNIITLNIFAMGLQMNTDPNDGTGGTGHKNGVTWWLNQSAPGLFTVTHQYASGTWSPKISDVTLASLQGGISNFCYGRYDVIGDVVGIPIIDRTGGHCVTLVKAAQTGSLSDILIRDPADAPADSVQMEFTSRQWFGNDLVYARSDAAGGPLLNIRTMTRLDAPGSTGLRLIDSYLSIKPKFGLTFTNEEIPPQIKFTFPGGGFKATPQVFEGQFALNSMIAIDAMVQSPDLNTLAVVGNIDGIKGVGLLTPESGQFDVLELDPTLKDAVFGRFRELYVAVGQQLKCYDLDAPKLEPIPFPWPFPPTGVAFSDFDDQVHTIARFGTQIASIPARFPAGIAPIVRPLPMDLPIGAEPKILASPVDDTLWAWSDAANQLFQFQLTDEGDAWELLNTAEVEGCMPTSVAMGDGGFLFVVCDGSVKELRPFINPDGGTDWKVYEDSIFRDIQAPGGFIPECSRTNFDPAEHGIPSWEDNILPDELEFGTPIIDCLGDLNDDRVVDAADLGILLNSFGNDYIGDLNVDQVTDAADLGLLLAVFGQECP